jgi:hypothetical protein
MLVSNPIARLDVPPAIVALSLVARLSTPPDTVANVAVVALLKPGAPPPPIV